MQRLPSPAQYLLRVDDVCPTMDLERWSAIRELIRVFAIRPILAVVPDNRDAVLQTSAPHPGFWQEMRAMQAEGATIAMHGYQHACRVVAASLVPLHRRSEFAGLPLSEQRCRVRAGLVLLRKEGLSPRLFVAPNHSFDRATLRALREEGLPCLSDGFARIPCTRDGVTWIPQQLWSPVSRRKGLWTICLHPDSMGPRRILELRRFLRRHAERFTCFEQVMQAFASERLSLSERVHERVALLRVLLHLKRKRILR